MSCHVHAVFRKGFSCGSLFSGSCRSHGDRLAGVLAYLVLSFGPRPFWLVWRNSIGPSPLTAGYWRFSCAGPAAGLATSAGCYILLPGYPHQQ